MNSCDIKICIYTVNVNLYLIKCFFFVSHFSNSNETSPNSIAKSIFCQYKFVCNKTYSYIYNFFIFT